MFSLESPYRGDSIEYTQCTIFNMKKTDHPKLSQICSNGIFSKELKNKFQTAMVNKPAAFKPLKVYCMFHYMLYYNIVHKGHLERGLGSIRGHIS